MKKQLIPNNNKVTQTDTQPMTSSPWKVVAQITKYKNEDTRPSHKIGGRRLSNLLKIIDLSG